MAAQAHRQVSDCAANGLIVIGNDAEAGVVKGPGRSVAAIFTEVDSQVVYQTHGLTTFLRKSSVGLDEIVQRRAPVTTPSVEGSYSCDRMSARSTLS